jgi:hypothetical protein
MKTRQTVEEFVYEIARDARVEGIGMSGDRFKEVRVSAGGRVFYIVGSYSSTNLRIEREVDDDEPTPKPEPEPAPKAQPEMAKETEF